MSDQITCLLTGKTGRAINAHIIPKSFYPFERDEKGNPIPLQMVRIGEKPESKRTWNGVSDNQIVTADGEAFFSKCDTYAHQFLVKKNLDAKVYLDPEGNPHCIEVPSFDYKSLKLFFISLLWRASVSKDPFFSIIDVGEFHKKKLREHILTQDPGGSQDYGVMLGIHRDMPSRGFPIIGPEKFRANTAKRTRHYKFHLGQCIACIKVDSQHWGPEADELLVSSSNPLRYLVLDDFKGTKLDAHLRAGVKHLDSFEKARKLAALNRRQLPMN